MFFVFRSAPPYLILSAAFALVFPPLGLLCLFFAVRTKRANDEGRFCDAWTSSHLTFVLIEFMMGSIAVVLLVVVSIVIYHHARAPHVILLQNDASVTSRTDMVDADVFEPFNSGESTKHEIEGKSVDLSL